MDDDMKDELHSMANQDRTNMSEFVRRLINKEIERRTRYEEYERRIA